MLAAMGSFAVFFGVRGVAGAAPDALLPALSAAATAVGFFWVLSPLLTGVAFSEAHDMTRHLHSPIPLSTLAASSIVATSAAMSRPAAPISCRWQLARERGPDSGRARGAGITIASSCRARSAASRSRAGAAAELRTWNCSSGSVWASR